MKSVSEPSNFCNVSISVKDNCVYQIRRVICEEVTDGRYTLVLVPKHDNPQASSEIFQVCRFHNIEAQIGEDRALLKKVEALELENRSVRVIIPDLHNLKFFVQGLTNVKAISEGDVKKILSVCSHVKNEQCSIQYDDSEELTNDEYRPLLPNWVRK